MGDLSNDVLGGGAPWLTYLRYDAQLGQDRRLARICLVLLAMPAAVVLVADGSGMAWSEKLMEPASELAALANAVVPSASRSTARITANCLSPANSFAASTLRHNWLRWSNHRVDGDTPSVRLPSTNSLEPLLVRRPCPGGQRERAVFLKRATYRDQLARQGHSWPCERRHVPQLAQPAISIRPLVKQLIENRLHSGQRTVAISHVPVGLEFRGLRGPLGLQR